MISPKDLDAELLCYDCDAYVRPILVWSLYQVKEKKMRHLGAWCPNCGRWIKWVPQDEFWLSKAPPIPESEV